jgi:membrane AbrB-like protein
VRGIPFSSGALSSASIPTQALTLGAGFLGGAALAWFGVPAGWLSGAMIGVGALAAAGKASPLHGWLRTLAIVLSGLALGSGATPAALGALGRYPVSLLLLAVAIAAMTASSYFVLRRTPGFSQKTAFYSAVPGALTYVFVMATQSSADPARVAIVQIFRIFVLMALVPIIAARSAPAGAPAYVLDPAWTTLPLLAGALIAAGLLAKAGVAAGALYAAIAVSALAHATSWAPGRMSPPLQIVAQTLVGAWIGTRLIGFDWSLMRQLLLAAVTSFLAAFAAAAAFAALVSMLIDVPFAEAIAAFAPGGLEAMTMMAFALGLDPLFVGSHHFARFLLISLALPIVTRRMRQE